MSESDYGHLSITVLAAEIEEEVVRVKNLEAAIDDLPEARERLAALKAEMAKRVSPEQPSYKHPEKDILNLSEDEDSTEAVIDSEIESVPLVGAGFSVPVEEVKSAFAGFDFVEKELPEGVLAEAVSANGEKVVITE